MGSLERFFREQFGQSEEFGQGSFAGRTPEEIETHLAINRYGTFLLTEAIRPSYDLQVKPEEGYRHDLYKSPGESSVPVLIIAASREKLWELFLDLQDCLGQEPMDVIVKTSHRRRHRGHTDHWREGIDPSVLKSVLWEHEDLLLNDGCTGIAVVDPRTPREIQFDEHKLLITYGAPLGDFEEVLRDHHVPYKPHIKFLTAGEHIFASSGHYEQQARELMTRLNIESFPSSPGDDPHALA